MIMELEMGQQTAGCSSNNICRISRRRDGDRHEDYDKVKKSYTHVDSKHVCGCVWVGGWMYA